MATDQATTDYEQEQEKRALLQDNWADWTECEMPQPNSPAQKLCAQCINWQFSRLLHLADSTTQLTPGFCTVRDASDLSQQLPAHDECCRFYEADMPF